MTAKTHDIFALASLITVSAYYPPETLSIATVITAVIANNIGALIPDLDSATNRLWDLLPAGDFLGKIFRRVFWKHRTLSHSFAGAFLLYLLLDWTLPRLFNQQNIDYQIVLFATMIGYLSHLLADGLTKEGLPLLFPINLNFGFPPIKALRITTGKWIEKIIVFPGVVAYIFWFTFNHQQQLITLFHAIK